MTKEELQKIIAIDEGFRMFPYHPNWNIDVYNLEMVIRLAYAINSHNSHKFRQFIMNRLMGRPMYENVCVYLPIQ